MKIINITLIAILAFGLSTSFTTTNKEAITENVNELSWFTDFQKADAESKKTGKPIFGFFTGSDWCGWCTRLKANVFAKDDFKKWAKESVILLELDFPRKTPISDDLKKQNRELGQKFQVSGYPTGIFINSQYNSEGKLELNELGRHAVQLKPGTRQFVSPNTWIAEANKILKNK